MGLKTNEWHELSLHKDISFIKNNINKGQNDTTVLLFELLLSLISIVVDNVLANSSVDKKTRIWIAISFGVVIIMLGIYWCAIKWYNYQKVKLAIKHNRMDGKHYIDEFDNSICYIAMAAHSYIEIYYISKSIAEKQFYLLECDYYLKKCINSLFLMRNLIPNIFCKEENNQSASLVDCTRLENVIELLKEINDFLNKNNYTSKLKQEYVQKINNFLDKYNHEFSCNIQWN